MRAFIFDYIKQEVAHAHAQNAPLEWFSSTPGLGAVPRMLSQICWLHITVIDIHGLTSSCLDCTLKIVVWIVIL